MQRQRTLEEFKLENQGCPVEHLRTVPRSPFVFWSKLAQRTFGQSIDLEAIVPSLHSKCCIVARTRSLSLSIHVAYYTWSVAVISKRKGQQWLLMSEQLLCSCNGFCGASEPEAGTHVTCRLADGYLERIRRLFSNL